MMAELQVLWHDLLLTPLLGLTLTLGAYVLACTVYIRAHYAPWASPIIWAVLMIGVILWGTNTSYEAYFEGAKFIHFLLGPSVVALAFPLWERLPQLRKQALPLLGSSLVGGTVAVASALLLAWAMGLPAEILMALLPKSLTSPVAMGVAQEIGAIPALAAVFAAITGVIGGVIGKTVLQLGRIRSDAARGYALGTCSHGVGTASAFLISPSAGAYSALAMSVQAVLGALLIPLIYLAFIK